MPKKIIITAEYNPETEEVDSHSDTGLTDQAFDELSTVLDEAGLTNIDIRLKRG